MNHQRDLFRLAELERRVSSMIRLATVSAVDHALARCRVEIGDVETAFLPWLTQRAGSDRTWWAPTVGEQVLLLAPGGELVCAVVLPAVYQAAHPAPASAGTVHRVEYSDGTSIEYDRAAHKLKVDCVGDIEAKATLSVKVDAGTSIKATSGTSAEINTGTTLTATVGTNLTANVTGNANLTAAAVNITATAINLTGAVNITGLTTATGDVVAMGKSLVTHTHNYNPGPGAPTPSLPPN